MNTSALILMLAVQVTVTGLTAWFYYRVLSSKQKPELDSYAENDDEPR
ncbi:MAG: hypothetical protein JNM31_09425 [Flavobacteriales bacterium]|nr:hypothetical protein [Flavobacteriales bacterium]